MSIESYFQHYEPKVIVAKKQQLIRALLDGKARFATEAAELCEIPFSSFYWWKRNDPEFAELWDDAVALVRERRLDVAEAMLDANIAARDNTAIIFYLKTQGKARDYNERVDVHQTITHQLDIGEAARRIAFAMNSALERGQVVEGNFTEVIQPISEQKEMLIAAKRAGVVPSHDVAMMDRLNRKGVPDSVPTQKAQRKAKKARREAPTT